MRFDLTKAEKLTPWSRAASTAASLRFLGTRRVMASRFSDNKKVLALCFGSTALDEL